MGDATGRSVRRHDPNAPITHPVIINFASQVNYCESDKHG